MKTMTPGSGAQAPSYLLGTQGSFPGDKMARGGPDHSLSSKAEWCYTCTTPYRFMAHTAQPCLTCAYLTDRPFSHAMQCTLSSTRRQMAQCQPRYIPENDRNSKHETSERQKQQHNANRNHFSHIAVPDNNCHNANAAKCKMRPHSVQSTKHSRGHEMNSVTQATNVHKT